MTNIDGEDKAFRDGFTYRLDSLKNRNPDNCPPSGLLSGYLEKKLSGKVKRIVEDHIAQCPLCVRTIESLSTAVEKELPMDFPEIEKKMDDKFYTDLRNLPAIQREKVSYPAGKFRLKIIDSWHTISGMLFQSGRLAYSGALACLPGWHSKGGKFGSF